MSKQAVYHYIKMFENIVILTGTLFIADRLIGHTLKKIYFKQQKGDYYQTTYAVDSARQQLLIFGSSRASHHYVSSVFEKYTNKSVYNLGRDGRNILYSEAIFLQVLSNHKPDDVILDVTPNEFSWKAGNEGRSVMVNTLLPYTYQPTIYKIIEKADKSELILSKVFQTYPYNSIAVQVLGNYFGVLNGEQNIKGYVPLLGNKISKEVTIQTPETRNAVNNDLALVNSFKNFLALAKSNKITCRVVVSPIYHVDEPNCLPYLKKITESYGLRFYDYSDLKIFKDSSLFYDNTHLNDKGATIFSNLLASNLTNDLK
ncbi:DUF1574 family protein [Mucilaginibacter sp. UR6-11]|uniref:DUF1574 family protein n=1 Tax=Mucilaginibacter sp. UR6-11 TaxID=1435644 RepID=UPI001E597BC8|nr:DUF1574 family protein [Mucilaginibacter sp. UR6-11]MCC8426353.1 DUF1574 domain-containing protein [Mucilaginibacter sp. UR6-11]